MERRDKTNYYLDIAQAVAKRGTCLRRKFGSIIVSNDEIIATGYAGAPRGRKNCSDTGAVRVTSSEFRAASGMRCAAVSTRRQCNHQRGAARHDWRNAVYCLHRSGDG